MGEGGWLSLINATPYTWHRGYHYSHSMEAWDFPSSVSPGELAQVWVARQGDGRDPVGDVNYTVTDPDTSAMQIQFRMEDDGRTPTSNIHFETIRTISTPEKRDVSVGFHRNRATPLVLAGDADSSFVSNDVPVDWMHQSLDRLGCLALRQICIPGTHDSGMSRLDGKTAFADRDNTVTQRQDVWGQLRHGARFLDIRPVKAGGTYKTGHYSGNDVDLGFLGPLKGSFIGDWLGKIDDKFDDRFGGNGQTIDDVVGNINDFLRTRHELVVVRLSHAYDTDDGYKDLSTSQWQDLFKKMSKLDHLFHAGTNQDLTRLPLAAFIADSPAVVVIVDEEAHMDLKGYAGKGFFKRAQFPFYDEYANTDDQNRMIDDQKKKLQSQRKDANGQMFLLSFTMTQQAGSSLGIPGRSILQMADDVFPRMFEAGSVWSAMSDKTYPNIITVDGLQADSRLRAFAMAINRQFAPKVKGLESCKAALEKKTWKRSVSSWSDWLPSFPSLSS